MKLRGPMAARGGPYGYVLRLVRLVPQGIRRDPSSRKVGRNKLNQGLWPYQRDPPLTAIAEALAEAVAEAGVRSETASPVLHRTLQRTPSRVASPVLHRTLQRTPLAAKTAGQIGAEARSEERRWPLCTPLPGRRFKWFPYQVLHCQTLQGHGRQPPLVLRRTTSVLVLAR